MIRDMPATPAERDRMRLEAILGTRLWLTTDEAKAILRASDEALFSARWGLTPAPGERFGGLGVLTSPPPGAPGGAMVRG